MGRRNKVSYIGTKEEMQTVPRVQGNRSNIPVDTPLLYCKRSIGIPFIECFAESNTIFDGQN